MAALPEQWESDYDGSRWFYRYVPTGLTQFHFPKPGDEFPQFIDSYAPIPDLAPEEKLESQHQLRRRGSNGERSRVSGSGPGKQNGNGMSANFADMCDDGAGNFNSYEQLMYMPGAYNDVSPVQDDVERTEGITKAHGKSESGVSPMMSAQTTPHPGTSLPSAGQSSSAMVETDIIAGTQPHVPNTQSPDVATLGSRHSPFSPIGIMPELYSNLTALAREETHPTPVELPDHASAMVSPISPPDYHQAFAMAPVELATDTTLSRYSPDNSAKEQKALQEQRPERLNRKPRAPLPEYMSMGVGENLSRRKEGSRSPHNGFGQNNPLISGSSSPTVQEGYRPYSPGKSAEPRGSPERGSEVLGNISVREAQDLEIGMGSYRSSVKAWGASKIDNPPANYAANYAVLQLARNQDSPTAVSHMPSVLKPARGSRDSVTTTSSPGKETRHQINSGSELQPKVSQMPSVLRPARGRPVSMFVESSRADPSVLLPASASPPVPGYQPYYPLSSLARVEENEPPEQTWGNAESQSLETQGPPRLPPYPTTPQVRPSQPLAPYPSRLRVGISRTSTLPPDMPSFPFMPSLQAQVASRPLDAMGLPIRSNFEPERGLDHRQEPQVPQRVPDNHVERPFKEWAARKNLANASDMPKPLNLRASGSKKQNTGPVLYGNASAVNAGSRPVSMIAGNFAIPIDNGFGPENGLTTAKECGKPEQHHETAITPPQRPPKERPGEEVLPGDGAKSESRAPFTPDTSISTSFSITPEPWSAPISTPVTEPPVVPPKKIDIYPTPPLSSNPSEPLVKLYNGRKLNIKPRSYASSTASQQSRSHPTSTLQPMAAGSLPAPGVQTNYRPPSMQSVHSQDSNSTRTSPQLHHASLSSAPGSPSQLRQSTPPISGPGRTGTPAQVSEQCGQQTTPQRMQNLAVAKSPPASNAPSPSAVLGAPLTLDQPLITPISATGVTPAQVHSSQQPQATASVYMADIPSSGPVHSTPYSQAPPTGTFMTPQSPPVPVQGVNGQTELRPLALQPRTDFTMASPQRYGADPPHNNSIQGPSGQHIQPPPGFHQGHNQTTGQPGIPSYPVSKSTLRPQMQPDLSRIYSNGPCLIEVPPHIASQRYAAPLPLPAQPGIPSLHPQAQNHTIRVPSQPIPPSSFRQPPAASSGQPPSTGLPAQNVSTTHSRAAPVQTHDAVPVRVNTVPPAQPLIEAASMTPRPNTTPATQGSLGQPSAQPHGPHIAPTVQNGASNVQAGPPGLAGVATATGLDRAHQPMTAIQLPAVPQQPRMPLQRPQGAPNSHGPPLGLPPHAAPQSNFTPAAIWPPPAIGQQLQSPLIPVTTQTPPVVPAPGSSAAAGGGSTWFGNMFQSDMFKMGAAAATFGASIFDTTQKPVQPPPGYVQSNTISPPGYGAPPRPGIAAPAPGTGMLLSGQNGMIQPGGIGKIALQQPLEPQPLQSQQQQSQIDLLGPEVDVNMNVGVNNPANSGAASVSDTCANSGADNVSVSTAAGLGWADTGADYDGTGWGDDDGDDYRRYFMPG